MHALIGYRRLPACLGLWFAIVTGPDLVWADKLPDPADLPARAELPDPFVMFDGTPVRSKQDWYEKRRPELKRLFQHYMYGYAPPPPKIQAQVTRTVPDVLEGRCTLKEVTIAFPELEAKFPSRPVPRIHLAVFLPNGAEKRPAPVFLALNKCGNHTVLADPRISITRSWQHQRCGDDPEAARGSQSDFWCVAYLISRGYGFATFHESDIDPDRPDFTDGIHPYFTDLPGPPESRWGTIAAWAWGLQRAVDYLVQDPDVDSRRICLTGHSRRGKTALLAAAFDERVALVVPHQSGTGGTALSRNNDQETVERINRVFPHWFNDMFTRFNDQEERLPIDQHLLIALVAPRPFLETSGLKDTWANYPHSLRAIQAADSVWKFLGAPGIVGRGVLTGPTKITRENAGNVLQYRLDTKHTLNVQYWEAILDFADLWLPGPGRK